MYSEFVLRISWFSSHAPHLDTVINSLVQTLFFGSQTPWVKVCPPWFVKYHTTNDYHMVLQVLNSKYNRIYGTIESMVSAKLCDESNKPPKDSWALYIYISIYIYTIALWSATNRWCVVKCVSQKRNYSNNKNKWYNILVTFIIKFSCSLY